MKKTGTHYPFLFLLLTMLLAGSFTLPASAAAPALSAKKITLEVGKSATLKVKHAKGKIKWSSGNKKIAMVNKKGKVSAKKKGTATITARTGKKTLKCKVTVRAKKVKKTNKTSKKKAATIAELRAAYPNTKKDGLNWNPTSIFP